MPIADGQRFSRVCVKVSEGIVMSTQEVEIVGYSPEYGLGVVKVWRQSFQRAMNLQEENQSDDLNGQLDHFSSIDPAHIQVAIDTPSSTIAGFIVLAAEELDHLYINVAYQGLGLGSRLLNEAKAKSPQRIELYTFQKNKRAREFYESHGFVEIERGIAELGDNPWASSQEELADIKYVWTS